MLILQKLVDKAFAKTNAKNEQMLPSKSDHANICCIAIGSTESTAIISFIETAAKKANAEIKRKSRECKLADDVTWESYCLHSQT